MSDSLRQLARLRGILDEYVDHTGTVRCQTSDTTRVALLAAMGIDANSEDAAKSALEQITAQRATRLVPPVQVVRVEDSTLVIGNPTPWAPMMDPGGHIDWQMTIRMETGAELRTAGAEIVALDGTASVQLPSLPTGYHQLDISVTSRDWQRGGRQLRIVVPDRCPSPDHVLHGKRANGLAVNLYSVRSARNWGIGDTTDLKLLLSYASMIGAVFVGVNPLHALRNRGGDINPYSPVSRLFRNVAYIDIQSIPEIDLIPEVRATIENVLFQDRLDKLRDALRVDYGAVMQLKRPMLETLFAVFQSAPESSHRRIEFSKYRDTQGRSLNDFATFCALEEYFQQQGLTHWQKWPLQFRNPESEAVIGFRERHAENVDFHRWMQFELDRQLAATSEHASQLGLPVGVYHDLAIGTSPSGSDTWVYQQLFATGATVGAPPDALATEGQNWGLPPVNPHRLVENNYEFWVQLLRANLRHAGALRIDHVLGMFRQFWIPEGKTGNDGAYVQFPMDDLLGIVALESERAGALVIGEDLGIVPQEIRAGLARWGILSSRVLYFERDGNGEFLAGNEYPRMSLATATTHDLPTLTSFWNGDDISLRASLGLVSDQTTEQAERDSRSDARAALLRRLRSDSIVPEPAAKDSPAPTALDMTEAVHSFLRRTAAWLTSFSLDDLTGETEPVNVPGLGPDRYSSWTRRLRIPLESFESNHAMNRALGIERYWTKGTHASVSTTDKQQRGSGYADRRTK